MSRCLCCGKVFQETAPEEELATGWHRKCIKSFFGTKLLPDIDVTEEVLNLIAIESTSKGYTIPGVQKKLSLHLTADDTKEKPRLTLVNYPTGYILKPQTKAYRCLPESEYLVMHMAKEVGIKTVPFALIRQGNELAYITKRIDRPGTGSKKGQDKMLAMEDFCQLDRRLTQDKYKGSYERCAKVIDRYSARAGLDMTEFFLRIVFSYIIGNSDMHLKNFSLVEIEEGSQVYVLSQAYDMLPVKVILPEDQEQMALTLNGKKRNLRKKDFLILAEKCHIEKKIALRLIGSILKKNEKLMTLCRESYLPEDMKAALTQLIEVRISNLL